MGLDDIIPEEENDDEQEFSGNVSESTLNKTEKKAYEYLISDEDYDKNKIKRDGRRSVPDFQCIDETYEAKRVVDDSNGSYTIYIGHKQIQELNDADPIMLIFRDQDKKPMDSFRWSNYDDTKYNFSGAVYEGKRKVTGLIDAEQKEQIHKWVENDRLESESHAVKRAVTLLIEDMKEDNRSNPW